MIISETAVTDRDMLKIYVNRRPLDAHSFVEAITGHTSALRAAVYPIRFALAKKRLTLQDEILNNLTLIKERTS